MLVRGGKLVPKSGPRMVAGQRAQAINAKAYEMAEAVRNVRTSFSSRPEKMRNSILQFTVETVDDAFRTINRAYINAQASDDLTGVVASMEKAGSSLRAYWPKLEDQNLHKAAVLAKEVADMCAAFVRDVKAGRIA